MQLLKSETEKFEVEDFSVKGKTSKAINIFFGWFLSSSIYVFVITWLSSFKSVDYLSTAIEEGIGPTLWNVMGSIGIMLFLLSIMLYPLKAFAKAAEVTLENTFAVGSLMFGLLLGQLISTSTDMITNLETWKLWVIFPFTIVSFLVALALNAGVWYLSFLIKTDGLFYQKLGKFNPATRVISSIIVGTPVVWYVWFTT